MVPNMLLGIIYDLTASYNAVFSQLTSRVGRAALFICFGNEDCGRDLNADEWGSVLRCQRLEKGMTTNE